jgi:ABC-type multidrug transport system ATPase subunit
MPLPFILHAQHLSFGYVDHCVFSGLSLQLPAGVSLVLGGDGSGKTTLLKVLAGELAASAGHLQLNGSDSVREAAAYRQQVFWVDPRTQDFDAVSPANYFVQTQRQYPQWDAQVLQAAIVGLSLEPHMHKAMYMLSTRSKRKVWLAAAFASGAALTLLDDPCAALDQPSVRYVLLQLQVATQHALRAVVLAQYEAPAHVALAATVDLGGV